MVDKEFSGNSTPAYGEGSPVSPMEHGNIDISSYGLSAQLSKGIKKRTMVYGEGPAFSLIPKVLPNGTEMDNAKAIHFYKKTNGHLGRFESEQDAKMYRDWLGSVAKEMAEYFPDEDITVESPKWVQTKQEQQMAAVNRSVIRSNIKQVISISKKALGSSISRIAERFDPNAIDGDNDGIVQDGTMYARPALAGAPVIAAMRSLSGAPTASDDAKRAASKMSSILKREEPAVTKQLKQIESMSNGRAKLVDLDTRLKPIDSYAKKIERLKANWNDDIPATATQMNDGLRYTFVVGKDDDYAEFTRSTISMLQADGLRVTSWNYWGSGDPYSGVNTMVSHPNGFNYEIQFHTPKSLAAKKKLAPLYEKFRDEKDSDKRKALYDRMRAITADLEVPRDTESISRSVQRGHAIAAFTPEMAIASSRSRASVPDGTIPKITLPTDILPDGEAIKNLNPRDKRNLDKLTEDWMGLLMAAVYGRPETLPMGYRGMAGRFPLVGTKAPQYKPGGANVTVGSQDAQQEVLMRLIERVGQMVEAGDYSFLEYAPTVKSADNDDSGLSWWNSRLRQLPESLREKAPYLSPRDSIRAHPTVKVERRTVDEEGKRITEEVRLDATMDAVINVVKRRVERELVRRERAGKGGAREQSAEERASGIGLTAVSLQTPRGGDDSDGTLEDIVGIEDDVDAVAGEFATGGVSTGILGEAEGIVGDRGVELESADGFYGIPDTLSTEDYIARLEDVALQRGIGTSETISRLARLQETAPNFAEIIVDFYFKNMDRREAEKKWRARGLSDYSFRLFFGDEGYSYEERGVNPDPKGRLVGLGRLLGSEGSDLANTGDNVDEALKLVEKIINDPTEDQNEWRQKNKLSIFGVEVLKLDWDAAKRAQGLRVNRRLALTGSPEEMRRNAEQAVRDALAEGPLTAEQALRIMRSVLGFIDDPSVRQTNISNWKTTVAKKLGISPAQLMEILKQLGVSLRSGATKQNYDILEFKMLHHDSNKYSRRVLVADGVIKMGQYAGLPDEIAEEPGVGDTI